MVDCFDRIHLQLTEVVLRPLKELREQAIRTSVTIRAPGRGPRIYVTVSKCWPDGPDHPPQYRWSTDAGATGADACSASQIMADEIPLATPEEAYWSALDTVAASRRQPDKPPAIASGAV